MTEPRSLSDRVQDLESASRLRTIAEWMDACVTFEEGTLANVSLSKFAESYNDWAARKSYAGKETGDSLCHAMVQISDYYTTFNYRSEGFVFARLRPFDSGPAWRHPQAQPTAQSDYNKEMVALVVRQLEWMEHGENGLYTAWCTVEDLYGIMESDGFSVRPHGPDVLDKALNSPENDLVTCASWDGKTRWALTKSLRRLDAPTKLD